jgi:hypothetical protein
MIEETDFVDQYGEPLYRGCQEKYGRLEPGECYGFFPALAISGIFGPHRTIENIRRVKAMEHFAILAQLDAFQLARVGAEGQSLCAPSAEARPVTRTRNARRRHRYSDDSRFRRIVSSWKWCRG